MSRFARITEDPFYDDDGNCVDEDQSWNDIDDSELDELGINKENFSPHNTINS